MMQREPVAEPIPDTLPELLSLVWKLAKVQTVECPGDGVAGKGGSVGHSLCHCTCCDDTGYIPNPAFAGLLALVETERQGVWSHYDCKSMGICQNLFADGSTPHGITDCKGTGFVLRTAYWQAAPEGALVLPLLQAARKAGMPDGDRVLLIAWNSCEPNLVALAAIVRWVEAKP